jgi:hypothetical protein
MRSTPTEMQSMSENGFELFASTGVNTTETMFPNLPIGGLRLVAALTETAALPRDQQVRLPKLSNGAVFFRHSIGKHRRTAESARNATALAIGTASDGWWSEWIAVVAILHSARHTAEENARATSQELRVDWCGGSSGSRLCCRSGTESNSAQLAENIHFRSLVCAATEKRSPHGKSQRAVSEPRRHGIRHDTLLRLRILNSLVLRLRTTVRGIRDS